MSVVIIKKIKGMVQVAMKNYLGIIGLRLMISVSTFASN